MEKKEKIVSKCRKLLDAYNSGKLGNTDMPEDSSPQFSKRDNETRLVYFTLPMALNYQRDSYKLWKSSLRTYNDHETRKVFDVKVSARMDKDELRIYLMKYKLALQPNKHIDTWHRISETIEKNWGSVTDLLRSVDYDFIGLREVFQDKFKKDLPYISGPKIFHYWSYILQRYGGIRLKNSMYIDIAPDTHITKCSVVLGLINKDDIKSLTKEVISERWRTVLNGSGINPIDMHSPLWFWSRNNFNYKL